MKDTQNDIFTAFIVALLQQTEPLPAEVQSEFNKIDENSAITEILRLTKLHPPLRDAYKNNRVWLTKHSNQRNKGLDVLPDSPFEKENTTNLLRDNAIGAIDDLTNLPQVIDKINTEAKPRGLRSILEKILQADNSVQASLETILSLIAGGLTDE